MLIVHHFSLCPFSRKLRVLLREKGIEHELFHVEQWKNNKEFERLSPILETPVIVDEHSNIIYSHLAVTEYIEEKYPHRKFYPTDIEAKAHVRKTSYWFDTKMFHEAPRYFVNEKIIKTLSKGGAPNSQALYAAKHNLCAHLNFIEYTTNHTRYLCGEEISMADIAAAAQLSVIDYLGDITWARYPNTKMWYSLIKSRPSFKSILNDRLPGINPPSYYHDLDF